ncbi:MAG: hypothetical protein WCE74_27095, partial [Pseudolabrys sp.]
IETAQHFDFMTLHINRQKIESVGLPASTRTLSSVRMGTLINFSGRTPSAIRLRSSDECGPATRMAIRGRHFRARNTQPQRPSHSAGAQFGREIGPIHPDCSRGHLRARAQFVSDFDDVAEERANHPHLMIGPVT